MNQQQTAALALSLVGDYDSTIVAPVLDDWANGRAFRPQDRHRLFILGDWIAARLGQPRTDDARRAIEPAKLTAEQTAALTALMQTVEEATK